MKTTAAAAMGSAAVSGARGKSTEKSIGKTVFYSTSSLVDSQKRRLTDKDTVAVWAEQTATNDDADGRYDAWWYKDDVQIPLVGVDGNVVGFGSMLVDDRHGLPASNFELIKNIWDEQLADGSTVLWDEGHRQYWSLDKFSQFEEQIEDAGYDVRPTENLKGELEDADAAVITAPGWSFWEEALRALESFVENGGVVFLHNQSDYQNYDESQNLNGICDRLSVSFRFNDDQVTDSQNNSGRRYKPTTQNYNTEFPFFEGGGGGGGEEPADGLKVLEVTDGDTVTVERNGKKESVRILGIDTAEKPRNSNYERPPEWEGIESLDTLGKWGEKGTQFAKQRLAGKRIKLTFDENADKRDPNGRLLGYVTYDATGNGKKETLYNKEILKAGYARTYDSGLTKHDEFLAAELDARKNSRGLWAESDPANTTPIRNDAVTELFFPKASSITTSSGGLSKSRTPVFSESSASVNNTRGKIPMVGVDEQTGVAMVGGPIISESYESAEGFGVDTSSYGNFAFLTNLLDALSEKSSGKVYIDGGHGQFGAEYALSAEDAAYYQRYLEGVGIGFEQYNSLTAEKLKGGRALLITTPLSSFSDSEIQAIKSFQQDGGAVVLLGSGMASTAAKTNLNSLARDLGTDLRIGADTVTDDQNNLDYNEKIITTTQLNSSFDLFGPFGKEGDGNKDEDKTQPDAVGTVTSVGDGDTFKIDLGGRTERVRILGIDTPEKAENRDAERPPEWEGIESYQTLAEWGAQASKYAKERLSGKTVELRYDDAEDKTDPFGRLLAYVHYDATGDGAADTHYNKEILKDGYARVYGSSLTKHDEFIKAEQDARKNNRGLWVDSDPENSTPIRNDGVEKLYFPKASGITTSSGALPKSRTPVFSESTAEWSGQTAGTRVPMVGVDQDAGIAMVGGPFIDEGYESKEGFDVDTSSYDNFAFLTNLLDALSEKSTGKVYIDGGHGQFGAEYASSNEDAAYYQRYLEGVGIGFEQINSLSEKELADGRALLITTPVSSFTDEEINAVQSFRKAGGSVVLLGSGTAPDSARTNLNDLASSLGTDLRIGSGVVSDYQNSLANKSKIITTTQLNSSFSLFGSFQPEN